MDDQVFHPPLDEGMLNDLDTVIQIIQLDPDYLPMSPYRGETYVFLEKFADLLTIKEDEEVEELGKWGRLEKESNNLFKMLTDFSGKLNEKDNTETMAYFRTATSLLDKIVGIQERAANLKQISMFHDTVLSIMDDVLEPGQRTAVMERLRTSITPGD